jgi:hypothetical protein
MAAMAAILNLVSVYYVTKAWVDWWLIQGDWFLSMTSAAAHSRWLLW